MKDLTSLKKILKIFRIILICFVSGVIFWLFYKDFVPNGQLVVENNFEKRSALISGLYPFERLKGIEKGADISYETIYIDPVYFDLTIPRFFKTAKIIIKYQNPSHNLFQLGIKDVNSDWNFLFKTIEDKDKGIEPQTAGEWREAIIDLNLEPWFIKERKLYFILSSPLLYNNQKEIKISQIKIILEREPWTLKNFSGRIKDYLKI